VKAKRLNFTSVNVTKTGILRIVEEAGMKKKGV
jgi:hypothetical protein